MGWPSCLRREHNRIIMCEIAKTKFLGEGAKVDRKRNGGATFKGDINKYQLTEDLWHNIENTG